MQLDRVSAELCGLLHRRSLRCDEEARPDARGPKPLNAGSEPGGIVAHVQAAFGGNLLATLRDERHLVWPEPRGDAEHLVSACHLEVEDGVDRGCEALDVRVLNVPPILAEMRGDAVGAR